jgi:hypothetical protein
MTKKLPSPKPVRVKVTPVSNPEDTIAPNLLQWPRYKFVVYVGERTH